MFLNRNAFLSQIKIVVTQKRIIPIAVYDCIELSCVSIVSYVFQALTMGFKWWNLLNHQTFPSQFSAQDFRKVNSLVLNHTLNSVVLSFQWSKNITKKGGCTEFALKSVP